MTAAPIALLVLVTVAQPGVEVFLSRCRRIRDRLNRRHCTGHQRHESLGQEIIVSCI